MTPPIHPPSMGVTTPALHACIKIHFLVRFGIRTLDSLVCSCQSGGVARHPPLVFIQSPSRPAGETNPLLPAFQATDSLSWPAAKLSQQSHETHATTETVAHTRKHTTPKPQFKTIEATISSINWIENDRNRLFKPMTTAVPSPTKNVPVSDQTQSSRGKHSNTQTTSAQCLVAACNE